MELSSSFCRTQEIVQNKRASSAILENVRAVAAGAAKAWALEGLAAERREARRERLRIIAEIAAIQKHRHCSTED